MSSPRPLPRVALGLAIALVALALPTAPASATATPQIDGTPLNVYADAVGNVQVRFDGTDVGEFEAKSLGGGYPPVAGGINLMEYGPENGIQFVDWYLPGLFAAVSGPASAGSGTAGDPYTVTSVYAAGVLTITQTFAYVNGDEDALATYTVNNTGQAAQRFRICPFANLYHGSTSLGAGFAGIGPPAYLGGANDAEGSLSGIEEVEGFPPPTAVWEGSSDFFASQRYPPCGGPSIGVTGLDDTFDPSLVDDALAAEWDDYDYNTPGLPVGQSMTIRFRAFFERYDGLALDPATATKTTGDTATVNATVLNHGDPVNGAVVRWSRSGANSGSGSVTTGSDGKAVISFTAANAGKDTLTAYTDSNKNGSRDDGETQQSVGVTWNAAPPPPPRPPPALPQGPTIAQQVATALIGFFARPHTFHVKPVLKAKGFGFMFEAPVAGALAGIVTSAPKGARSARRVVIARGQAAATVGAVRLKLRLTKAGTALLKNSRKLNAMLQLTFTPSGGQPQSHSGPVRLAR